jgi:hypothetical protein
MQTSLAVVLLLALLSGSAGAKDERALALQLQNPLSELPRLPYQFDYDEGYRGSGGLNALYLEAVVPLNLGDSWRVVSHTNLPALLSDGNWPGDAANDEGFGDIVQSFYFAPVSTNQSGFFWGVGPTIKLPTATEDSLGFGQLAIGPAAILLMQRNGFTYGATFNHLSTVAGDLDRRRINVSSAQPFVSYVTSRATGIKLSSEAFYDWEGDGGLAVPIIFEMSQMVRIGKQPLEISAGVKYWATSPERYADGWGWRIGFTYLFR